MADKSFPGGTATGIGSWPGEDAHEAAAIVAGEFEVLSHLVELPGRGLGADLIGRTAALLVDLPIDISTTGYKLSDRPSSVGRRAQAHLTRDLDIMEEVWDKKGLLGSERTVKAQLAGPVTLAAELELRNGRRVLTDRGAVRDLTDSLAEGVRGHLADLRRRLGVDVVLQLDEPQLPAALAGAIPGPSRFDPVREIPGPEALELIQIITDAAAVPVGVHCCGDKMPLELLRRSEIQALFLDVTTVRQRDFDHLGEWLQSGRALALGLVPSTAPLELDEKTGDWVPAREPDWRELADPALRLVDHLGFPREILAAQIMVTPACGLAGADPQWARRAVALATRIAAEFAGDPDAL
ncbi:methionine synthase [Tomitella biformata]|uniref:methionine synthase n=1 Tax=Tomitella biformata TaxID=630403 RepID=UPI0004631632|nr:methionine synthase [Tomitella biformata]